MEADLYSLLTSTAGITALCGQSIFWGIAAQGTPAPYIVLNVISGLTDYAYDQPIDLHESRVQIDCYTLDYLSCKNLCEAVLAKVSGFRGVQGATQFQGMFVDAVQDGFDMDETVERKFRRRIDVMIHHRGV